MTLIAQVIVDVAHPEVDRVFDYSIPAHLELEVGCRVLVPFGRQQREGLVIAVAAQSLVPREKLRPVIKLLDAKPILTKEDLCIAEHVAQHYRTTMAQALRLLLPTRLRGGGSTLRTENFVELAVDGAEFEQAMQSLLKKDGTPRWPQQIIVMEKLKMAPRGLRSAELPASSVKTLLKKNFIRIRSDTVAPTVTLSDVAVTQPPQELSGEQRAAVYSICNSGKRHFLLHGVTGSGKTEVYIRIIQETLHAGKTAILLVPEISLTPQTFEYLQKRLDVSVALFHSRLSDRDRYEQWLRVREGLAPVVLGPRSAVFAPVSNLGVIIIDEEHESAYKSDRFPSYTAREIAELRCDLNDALLVLGSATPSLAAYRDALEEKLSLVEMPRRLFGLPLPPVEVIDMRKELKAGNSGLISETLDDAIRSALSSNDQVMMLLNHRGYSSFLMCRSCGYVVQCDNCDVSMTYHKSEGMLKCHYCGARKEIPPMCPECEGGTLQRFGVGTQKLEEELRHLYPHARILRMDADTMSGRDAHVKAYEKFRDGNADILIGTQMIAKGFDFERVSVAAILAVDGMLHLPDYRSAERTFDQITQLAGRAGRQGLGRVFVQTFSPDNYAVTAAARHDYKAFFAEECVFRQSMHLPPFGSYLMARFSSSVDEDAKIAVRDFLKRLKSACSTYLNDIIKVRASASPIKRIKEQFRYQILIHLKTAESPVTDVLFDLIRDARYHNVLIGVDVDPANML